MKYDEPSLMDCGISHLTTLPLSFGRVNQPERAEDERATGDEPSRGPHCGSSMGCKKKKTQKKLRSKGDNYIVKLRLINTRSDTNLHLLVSPLVGRL